MQVVSLNQFSRGCIFIVMTSPVACRTLEPWTLYGSSKELLETNALCKRDCLGVIWGSNVSISTELYKDRAHFILELIQNADDNNYSATVVPTLRFRLSRSMLTVECNETGFTEKDVRSICEIHDSTKKERKTVEDGCIGEKGIGISSIYV